MTWNSAEAQSWMIKYANSLANQGNKKTSQALLYDLFTLKSCDTEESFKLSLKKHTTLDEVYINWAIKEVKHDG